MSLDNYQQIANLIKESNKILIVFKKRHHPDAIASALALQQALTRIGKTTKIACDEFVAPPTLSFLPDITQIAREFNLPQKLLINIDIRETPLKDLSYNIENNHLIIKITPENTSILPAKIAATLEENIEQSEYNLIFALDTEDLDSLGEIYSKNRNFFFNTPIINIDHKPANENFGQINFIQTKSTSTAEIIFEILNKLNTKLINAPIATCLLTGVITATKSFKLHSVTPQTLHIASQLVEKNGDRELIIKNIYYNRSLNTLKLWGRLLSNLQNDLGERLIWGKINENDFNATATDESTLPNVIDELISNIPRAELIALLLNKSTTENRVLVYNNSNHNLLEILKQWQPVGDPDAAEITLPKNASGVENDIINTLREYLGKQEK